MKPLNIGLSVWVPFAFAEVDPPDYDQDEVGYTKVSGTWGLAIRSVRGREVPGEDFEHVSGPWLFNDAAREMRIHSVEKIPEVIKALTEKASETTKRIQAKTKEVRAIAEAIRIPGGYQAALGGVDDSLKMGLAMGSTLRVSCSIFSRGCISRPEG